MKKAINVAVNGVSHNHEVEPRLLLVHYLRDVLGLTGTHVGCETSLCGACTILLDGQAVKSCTMWTASIETILRWAGLANDWYVEEVECGCVTGTFDCVFAIRSVET